MATAKKSSPAAEPSPENLHQLEAGGASGTPPRDLNAKLNKLESSIIGMGKRVDLADRRLRDFHAASDAANGKLEDRIEETHSELTELQQAYQKLNKQSVKLANDAKKLGAGLVEQRKALSGRIDSINDAAVERDAALSDSQDLLAKRTGVLENKARQLAESLESRLTALNATIEAMQARFSEQLTAVAEASIERDKGLDARIGKVAAEGAAALRHLEGRITRKTDTLTDGLNRAHQNIDHLFGRTDRLRRRGLIAVVVLLLIIGSLAAFQSVNEGQQAEQLQALQASAAPQTTVDTLGATVSEALDTQGQQISALEGQVQDLSAKVVAVEDISDSATGRLNAMNPLRRFGGDGIIHGPAWLAAQNADAYVLDLATVDNKDRLYELAQRRSYHLTEPLSYVLQGQGEQTRYRLIYGPFGSQAEAREAKRWMPPVDGWSYPSVHRLSEL